MNKKKVILIIVICVIIFTLLSFGMSLFNKKTKDTPIKIVPTLLDEITNNSAWCGNFQLIWNDIKKDLVKQDIIFSPQLKVVENLNQATFTEGMLSEEYYYKIWGRKSYELKNKIEDGIYNKFEQRSTVLDMIDWKEEDDNEYVFYSMLYRKFEYLKEFDSMFSNFKNKIFVDYFGIDDSTPDYVGNQIDVLYYESEDDFALLINTKNGDEVIFNKNPEGSNFEEIYTNMKIKANQYEGDKEFKDIDRFKAPKLDFNEIEYYDDLKNKTFYSSDGKEIKIVDAIQTIKFSLDEKGGEIKSETTISVIDGALQASEEVPRNFYVDDTFVLFLREEGKSKPYFAAKIDDIDFFRK